MHTVKYKMFTVPQYILWNVNLTSDNDHVDDQWFNVHLKAD